MLASPAAICPTRSIDGIVSTPAIRNIDKIKVTKISFRVDSVIIYQSLSVFTLLEVFLVVYY